MQQPADIIDAMDRLGAESYTLNKKLREQLFLRADLERRYRQEFATAASTLTLTGTPATLVQAQVRGDSSVADKRCLRDKADAEIECIRERIRDIRVAQEVLRSQLAYAKGGHNE